MPDPTPSNAAPRTVLIADDEPIIVRAMARLFADAGYEVHSVSSANAAKEILDEVEPDAVFVDRNMPGNGVSVLEKLHGRPDGFAGLSVLMTGSLDDGELGALQERVVRLQKPFKFASIVPMVEAHFGEGGPGSNGSSPV